MKKVIIILIIPIILFLSLGIIGFINRDRKLNDDNKIITFEDKYEIELGEVNSMQYYTGGVMYFAVSNEIFVVNKSDEDLTYSLTANIKNDLYSLDNNTIYFNYSESTYKCANEPYVTNVTELGDSRGYFLDASESFALTDEENYVITKDVVIPKGKSHHYVIANFYKEYSKGFFDINFKVNEQI